MGTHHSAHTCAAARTEDALNFLQGHAQLYAACFGPVALNLSLAIRFELKRKQHARA
jgi:hypothetical protein